MDPRTLPVATKEDIALLNFMLTRNWWAAADEAMIPNTVDKKRNRASLIANVYIDAPIEGQRCLDFGCGEGYVVKAMADRKAKVAVGYDIAPNPAWAELSASGPILTETEGVLRKSGPYDIVLLFDVYDHATDPADMFRKVRSVLAPGGQVFFRGHPWSSRHGGHMYRSLNKAFAHLVLSRGLIDALRDEPVPHPVIEPDWEYRRAADEAGFRVASLDVTRRPLEDVFRQKWFIEKVMAKNYDGSPVSTEVVKDLLTIEFVDMVLVHA